MSLQSLFASYNKESFPSVKGEEYRYSSVLPLIEALSPVQDAPALDIPWKSDILFKGGFSVEGPSRKFSELPAEFHLYKNYFKDASLALDSGVKEIVFPKEDEFHITFASGKNGVNAQKTYVHVPAGRRVQLYVHAASGENSLMMPQIYLDAQEDSHIELIFTADKKYNRGVLSPFFEMLSQKNAHTSFQYMSEGLAAQRLNFMGYVRGEGSHIDLRTGFYLKQNESADLYVRIFHHGADSTSNQIIKAVTLDEAQMNFNALIYASPEAKNIYAYQKLTGMLLGEKSRIFARPQLDIEYYELACSHGVSIGGFDPEELFYAQSRGIPAKDVYPMLLYGFFCEPFVGMPLEARWTAQIKDLLGADLV